MPETSQQTLTQIFRDVIGTISDQFISLFHTTFGFLAYLILPATLLAVLAFIIARILGAEKLTKKLEIGKALKNVDSNFSVSRTLGLLVFWLTLIMLMYVSPTPNIQTLIEQKVPNFLTGVFILIFGWGLANTCYKLIELAAAHSSLLGTGGRIIARIIYWLMLCTITIIGLSKMNLETNVLNNLLILVVGAFLFAASISYGLASKDILQNMLSSFFSRKNFEIGQTIQIDDIQGTIIKADTISVTIQTQTDQVVIPAKELITKKVHIKD